mmetsp:Transcript_35592/g.70062  ORF Transcript_35592/g.70062 Transcript_35592/m.70062 type:complete len:137 (-) Transcript_35592:121-531(-)|eukprot:CAMPEP_0194327280 /NCGR_PEP_ID=MMETSP0171-20130528/40381_1 /TAXON_ID=218684 /ORGANISM="Corethron pennatum, Strain L29A3" /LENGTH=136 /DNA_ID=CAMNT_0039087183 /DNA_START=118 /DNA_END=528 /DNA_ORIENTATION=+
MKILAATLAIFVLIDRSDGFTVPSPKAVLFNRVKTSIRAEAEAAPQEEEPPPGADYDGKGGLGMARGTKNTYVIPGMEDMSPEEYRTALQKSVSDRQAKRTRDGLTGNRAAHNYLEQLGWGGASKAMGRGRDAKDE